MAPVGAHRGALPSRRRARPPARGDATARFRPIGEELRDLERAGWSRRSPAAGGVQKRAAELIGMPLRTFTMKSKQYGLGERR